MLTPAFTCRSIGQHFQMQEQPMRIASKFWLSCLSIILIGICASGVAFAASKPHYVITNDDVPPSLISSVSFFTVAPSGLLTFKTKVLVGDGGIAGGYFPPNRVTVLDSGNAE